MRSARSMLSLFFSSSSLRLAAKEPLGRTTLLPLTKDSMAVSLIFDRYVRHGEIIDRVVGVGIVFIVVNWGRLERKRLICQSPTTLRTLDLGLKRQNENTFCNMLLTVTS